MTKPRPGGDPHPSGGQSADRTVVASASGLRAGREVGPVPTASGQHPLWVRGLLEGAGAGFVAFLMINTVVFVAPVALGAMAGVGVTPTELGFWVYLAVLQAAVGVPAGVLVAGVLLACRAGIAAVRPAVSMWRGWPWLAGVLVAVAAATFAVLGGYFSTFAFGSGFISGDAVYGVALPAVSGAITVWRVRAVQRWATGSPSAVSVR